MITKTTGEWLDELAILTLKNNFLKVDGMELPKTLQERLKILQKEYRELQKDFSIEPYFSKLYAINKEIWFLENSMRNLQIYQWFDGRELFEEMGKRAESIRKLNSIRVELKNQINAIFNEPVELKFDCISGDYLEIDK